MRTRYTNVVFQVGFAARVGYATLLGGGVILLAGKVLVDLPVLVTFFCVTVTAALVLQRR